MTGEERVARLRALAELVAPMIVLDAALLLLAHVEYRRLVKLQSVGQVGRMGITVPRGVRRQRVSINLRIEVVS